MWKAMFINTEHRPRMAPSSLSMRIHKGAFPRDFEDVEGIGECAPQRQSYAIASCNLTGLTLAWHLCNIGR
jgi:hypothetical protein